MMDDARSLLKPKEFQMRFFSFYRPSQRANPDPRINEEMAKLIERETKSGALVVAGGFPEHPQILRVRNAKGDVTVIDGPFAEAKELVGGFAILQAKSKEDVIEMARRFLKIAGDGECEIHQMADDA
jgi:hypothetical protein